MAAEDSATTPVAATAPETADVSSAEKGKEKGKAAAEDHVEGSAMDEDDEDGASDSDAEDDDGDNDEVDDDDEMAEIDAKNILPPSKRTRGKVIDFAKAAQENPVSKDDAEEEDDDEDYQEGEDEDEKMAED